MNGTLMILQAAVTFPLGVILTFLPYLTRRTESFGVSIEEKYFNDPDIRSMRTIYAAVTGAVSLLVVLGGLASAAVFDAEQLGWLMPAAVGVLLTVHTVMYLRFHFRMRILKEQRGLLSAEMQQTVIDTAFYREKRAYSQAWLIPHLVVAAVTAWMCIAYYDAFPDRIVMQYGTDGTPTRIVDKSYGTVLMPVFLQLFMILIFGFVNYGIAASKQQIDAADPKRSLQRNLIFRRRWSGFMLIMGFLLTLLFGTIPLQQLLDYNADINMGLWLTAVLVILLGTVRLGFITGQGGSRIRLPGDASESADGKVNRDDDKYWKLGQFYYNPDDPALFLEKRFGVGWTVNLARPLAWLILTAPLVLAAVLIIIMELA